MTVPALTRRVACLQDGVWINNSHWFKLLLPNYFVRSLVGKDLGAAVDPYAFSLSLGEAQLAMARRVLAQFHTILLLEDGFGEEASLVQVALPICLTR